jgi:2-keto-4-pentenoate hydratase/2-oxohepta-3-ene-1,7-dioic acid hydratase in catechol pathway
VGQEARAGRSGHVSTSVLRTAEGWWVLQEATAFPVKAELPTTAALVTTGLAAVRKSAAAQNGGVPVDRLSLLSPVTTPCRVVAQAVNYRSHAQEAGYGDHAQAVFFRKSSASISGPTDDVVRPAHVRLLDYEVELGLVMRAPLVIGTPVTDQALPDYVAGLVVSNDISARDVQLEMSQFYESKSYPTFTPTGPRLVLLDEQDFARLPALRLRLWVNGEIRQDATLTEMIIQPARALTLLAGFQTLDPGDLVLTGTPGGTALRAPPSIVAKVGGLLPPRLRWQVFFSREGRKPDYLKAGDVITASIATPDGVLDLGTQRSVVRDA